MNKLCYGLKYPSGTPCLHDLQVKKGFALAAVSLALQIRYTVIGQPS